MIAAPGFFGHQIYRTCNIIKYICCMIYHIKYGISSSRWWYTIRVDTLDWASVQGYSRTWQRAVHTAFSFGKECTLQPPDVFCLHCKASFLVPSCKQIGQVAQYDRHLDGNWRRTNCYLIGSISCGLCLNNLSCGVLTNQMGNYEWRWVYSATWRGPSKVLAKSIVERTCSSTHSYLMGKENKD